MPKPPFRAWRERYDLTQASAARLLGRSKRSIEMLDQAAELGPELDYACRWIGRYVIPESSVRAPGNPLERAHNDGSEAVLESVLDFNWHPSQVADRNAAADAALQKLKAEQIQAIEEYEDMKENLTIWLGVVDDFVISDESPAIEKILPILPSRSTSTTDIFDAAWKVLQAKEAVEGGKIALAAIHRSNESEDDEEEE